MGRGTNLDKQKALYNKIKEIRNSQRRNKNKNVKN